MRGKDKHLVQQKGYIAELDIWEGMENLKNAKEAIEEFEKEYRGYTKKKEKIEQRNIC